MKVMQPTLASKKTESQRLAQLKDHSGQVPTGTPDFFASPPSEIGELWTAESTLKEGREPMSPAVRVLIVIGIPVLCVAGFFYFASQTTRDSDRFMWQVIGIAAAVGLLVLLAVMTRYRATCSYVGALGVAKFTLRGNRQAEPKLQRLLFVDATELRAAQVRQFVNGVYTGTNYSFTWTNATGQRVYHLKGQHRGKKKPPKQGDPFHFARMAEIAWSEHVLGRAQQVLQAEGSIPFRVDKSRWLRVGPGFLEFHFGENPVRVTREEIASVALSNGQFSFKHKDAKWFSRAGKFSFSYGGMANAKVFLLALDKLMGYRWG
jgi:hypothetical protein